MNPEAIIKNRPELATTDIRAQALDIIEAGISCVLPAAIMHSSLSYEAQARALVIQGRIFDVSRGRLFVVGGGKASGLMVQSVENILGSGAITSGIVTTKYRSAGYQTERISVVPAGHPVPDESGVKAVRKMLDLKRQYSIQEDDVVLCLLSGGGSALMPYPADEIALEEKQKVTGLLLASGADITEINAVRKHLSCIKGGKLGQYFAPATVISLILSDVIGNDLSVIASGPTHPDPSTFSDALRVLDRYRLRSKIPAAAVGHLERGARGQEPETPKLLDNCHNFIIGDNALALQAMKNKAESLRLKACIVTSEQRGETTEAAASRARELLGGRYRGCDAILLGGETTPKLPPNAGKGGRNQHYAAVSMPAMKDHPGHWVIASVGTDGSDFLPDVAGAIVDDTSLPRLAGQGIDAQSYLDRYDSYSLLTQLGNSLVRTGNTGTNVGDIVVYILEK